MAASVELPDRQMVEPLTPKPGHEACNERAAYVGELFERFRGPLRIYLSGLLAGHPDAEDVLQESYARLLDAADLDRSPARARAYLFRIATNLALDRFRRRRTRGTEEPIETAGLASAEPTPDEIVSLDQGLTIIRQTLTEIDPRCRQVFLLRAREELSYEDIAQRLRVSKSTVERAMRQTLEICQRRLRR